MSTSHWRTLAYSLPKFIECRCHVDRPSKDAGLKLPWTVTVMIGMMTFPPPEGFLFRPVRQLHPKLLSKEVDSGKV